MASPCEGREEWTMGPTHDTTTDPDTRHDRQLALIRAQFTCYLKCPLRQQCLQAGLEYEADQEDRHHIWGGLLPRERDIVAEGGHLPQPHRTGRLLHEDERVGTILLDPTYNAAELCEAWGITWKGLKALLREQLHVIRVQQGDPAVMLHDGVVADFSSATSDKAASDVRAA